MICHYLIKFHGLFVSCIPLLNLRLAFLLLRSRIEHTAGTLPYPYNTRDVHECILLFFIFLSEAAFASCTLYALRFCAVDSSTQTNRAVAIATLFVPSRSVPALSVPALSDPAFLILPFLILLFLILPSPILVVLILLFLILFCSFLPHPFAFGFSFAYDICCLLKRWIPEYLWYQ